jgi:hypothetical protein
MPPSAADDEYRRVVERAAADPDVLGAILVGSRAIGAPFLRDGSDWDLRLIVRDEALEAAEARHATPHGSRVEVALMRLQTFEAMADPGSVSAWDRPSFVHGVVVLDKLDGGIVARQAALARLEPAAAGRLAESGLDDYVNSYYRSLKNAAIGLAVEAHLDAAESIEPLLTTLFAIHGRVRPFNRHLGWELDREPLGDGWLSGAVLLPRLEAILATGAVALQAGLFRDVEAVARARGLGEVIDSWEPDVERLRRGSLA